jgi:hypothetical protein
LRTFQYLTPVESTPQLFKTGKKSERGWRAAAKAVSLAVVVSGTIPTKEQRRRMERMNRLTR